MSENWLLIETSGRAGRVGLARDGAVVFDVALDAARRHARDLATTVGSTLGAAGLRPADLTGVMVSVGPGSYTGLRVGVMSVKALAYATGCQLVPVPTFAAIARRAPAAARHIWVIADALQGQIYLQRFVRTEEGVPPVPADELRIDRAGDWLDWAAADAWMTGPGVSVYADSNIPQSCRLVPEADREPTVESLFQAGREVRPVSREELFALEPLYLRGSSAEEKAKRDELRG
jgi:tRNA threonylcarbamoyladenosine biosynthesis protein TsaB